MIFLINDLNDRLFILLNQNRFVLNFKSTKHLEGSNISRCNIFLNEKLEEMLHLERFHPLSMLHRFIVKMDTYIHLTFISI